jgi:hypothetical protein
MTVSALGHFYRMDTTRPHLWWVSCENCHGTGIAHLQWNKAVWCSKCDRLGKVQVVVYRPDSLRVAERRLGIAICLAVGVPACYLIFFR